MKIIIIMLYLEYFVVINKNLIKYFINKDEIYFKRE